jgi:mycothiol synthase
VITYAWRTSLGPGEESELRQMLAEAAAHDAEAGFPLVSLDEAYGNDAAHLIVRLLPDDRAGHHARLASPTAAYLRLEPHPGGGPATARYVVRPEFRSRGVSTLLIEMIGLDLRADGGWAGTGVRALRIWARGDHPAARRMARRFQEHGVRPARREWQLLAPLAGSEPAGPGKIQVRIPNGPAEMAALTALWQRHRQAPVPADATITIAGEAGGLAGAVWTDPLAAEPTQYGIAGRIRAVLVNEAAGNAAAVNEETRRALLAAGMDRLRDHGYQAAAITIDARDGGMARSCRLMGFTHDRSDTEYYVSAY